MKLRNRAAIITGGSRGIGKAIALAFAGEGASIAIVSRTKTELFETKEEIEKISRGDVLAIVSDISDPNEPGRITRLTNDKFGGISILVNNAGVQGPIGPFFDNDINEWMRTITINLMGTVRMTKACLPYMMSQRYGRIINLSGGGAVSPRENFSAYGVSKAAVVRFSETLAQELKGYNIQVNSIAPGIINTRMTEEITKNRDKAGEREFLKITEQLEKGMAGINAVTSLAVYLASDESFGLTGRLISAVWDDWENLDQRIDKIMSTDAFTVRRIKEEEAR